MADVTHGVQACSECGATAAQDHREGCALDGSHYLGHYANDDEATVTTRTVCAAHGEPGNGEFATPSGPAREPGSAGCVSTVRQIDVGGAPHGVKTSGVAQPSERSDG